jgi:hypothetical protein
MTLSTMPDTGNNPNQTNAFYRSKLGRDYLQL